jgi:O-antigen/teichoic acid export membrane protein
VRISKKFLKSSLVYTLAGALPMASALVLLPLYVGYLSTTDFGALSIYFAFSYFIQLLTTYSFDTSLYIHFHEYKNDPRRLAAFSSSAFIFMLCMGVCVAVLFYAFGDLVFSNIFDDRSIAFQPYGLMAAFTGIFQALFKVHGNLLQTREKPELYLWSNIGSFALIAGATVVGLKLYPDSLMGPVGGRLLAAFVSGAWALNRIFREFGTRFDYPLIRASFSFNFYTFVYQLLQWVINYFDRIFMVFFLTLAEIGVYDFAIKCLLIIEFILNGLHNSFYPKIVSTVMNQEVKGSAPEINRYYHGFISVILLLICLCILIFPWAIQLLVDLISTANPDYLKSVQYIPYISLIYIFRAIRLFYAAPYGILKYTKPLSGIYLSVSVIKVGAMWLAIDRFGLFGVIAASIISSIVEIILLKATLRKVFRFRYNALKILIAPGIIFITIIVLEPLFGASIPNLIHFTYLLMCVGLLGWIYRSEIRLKRPFDMLR